MEEYIFGIMPVWDKQSFDSENMTSQIEALCKIIESERWVWNYEKISGVKTCAIYNLPKTKYLEIAKNLNIKEYIIGQVDFKERKALFTIYSTVADSENRLIKESTISLNDEQFRRYVTAFCLSNLRNRNYEKALILSNFNNGHIYWSKKDNADNLKIILDSLSEIERGISNYDVLCILSIVYKFDFGESFSSQIKPIIDNLMQDRINENVHQCFYLIRNYFNRNELSEFITLILKKYKINYKYPKSVCDIYEKYKVLSSINGLEINAIKSNLNEFNHVLDYLKLSIKDSHIRYSVEAILNYCLGDPVSSFKIYDETLDNGDYEMTSQDLYYYCVTSVLLDVESQSILESSLITCIKVTKSDRNWRNRYYLSLLYYLCKKQGVYCTDYQIEELLINDDELFSDLINYRNNAIKSYSHKIEVSSKDETLQLEWLDRYLRFYEANIIIDDTIITPEIWKFYSFKSCINDIEKEIIDNTIQETKDEITQIISKESDFPSTDINNWVKKQLLEIDPKRRKLYFDTKLGIDEGGNPENQIGLTISEFSAKDWKIYILLIYYFWINRKIDNLAAVSLSAYLATKAQENQIEEIHSDTLSVTTVALLLTPFAKQSTFYTLITSIISLIRHIKRNNTHVYQSQSEYEIYKSEFFKQIGNMDNTDSIPNLIKKLGFFSPYDKILQLKNFLENHNIKPYKLK